ncbi:sialidase family protein [Nonomuraea diastatica]|uniref:Exo-alpha-sialidase n=1 Tax=Nonomuraea diastatica TaxID=1848329 RepID=A0A4V2YFA5_9ACTN|nr:sialidase family protein [Nonomuraea diastatica]TDD22447.1 exo-alpha-sialidase [Nonomuraea diastatica]
MAPSPAYGALPPRGVAVPAAAVAASPARRRALVWGAVAAGVVLVLGAAAAFVALRPDGQVARKDTTAPQTGQVNRADRLFPPPSKPAPDGGLNQHVNAAAAHGDTVVVVGGESVGPYSPTRPIFLVSDDSGTTWKSVPPPGTKSTTAGLVAGGDKGWVAFPSRLLKHAPLAWTSADGHTWQPVSGDVLGDMVGYNLSGLVATDSGFVIMGAPDASAEKASPTAVWTSADGRQWQRVTTTTALPAGRTSMVAHGDNVLIDGGSADGTAGRLTARSGDGGRTWQTATLDTGTGTPVLATDGKSFYAAFSKEFKSTTIAGSTDGASWKEVGSSEGTSPKGFAVGPTGFYLLMDAVPLGEPGYGEEARLLHSEDGSGWDSLGTSSELNAYQPVMATTKSGALLSGDILGAFSTDRPERLDLRLFSAGPDSDVAPIDLGGVAGLRYPVTRVNDLRHAGDVTVAVGQSQGMASAWWSTDSGATWQRSDLETPGEFTAVVHGPSGWLAIGPGAYTSRDGRTWHRSGHAFGTIKEAAAAKDSYLVTSGKDAKRISWRSTDLVTWQQVTSPFEFPSGLAGGEYGYVAPGMCPDGGTTANCLMYSTDGRSWQRMPAIGLPDGQGAWVTEAVVGRDTVIVMGLAHQGGTSAGTITKTFSARLSPSGQWEKPQVAELGGQTLSELSRDGNAWIALRAKAGEMALVRSQDGRTWEPRTSVTWPKGMQSQAVAAAPDTILVVGSLRTDTEDYPLLGRLAP